MYRCSMDSTPHVPDGYSATVSGDIDTRELTALIVAAETAINGFSPTTESFVRMLMVAPDLDDGEGVLVLRDISTAEMAACGMYRNPDPHVESITQGWVHPSHRGRGLGSTIVLWGLEQARVTTSAAPEGTRVTNRCQASDTDQSAADLFTNSGYSPDRHEIEMEISFDGPVTVAGLPAGVTVRTASSEADVMDIARVISEAFRDHYGWVGSSWADTMERWRNYRTMEEWDDDLVFIADTPDGPVGALVGLRSHGARSDVGFIGSLGIVRSWRGRGLARALLTMAFDRFQQRGMRAVALDVDADSLTGETELYRSVGMPPVRSEPAYLIELRPGVDLATR
jgi:mycothiol synthase